MFCENVKGIARPTCKKGESHGTYINQTGIVPILEIVEDAGLVQTSQLGHVLHLVELGRIHLLDVVPGDEGPLTGVLELDLHLVVLLALDAGGDEALVLVRHPHEPFLRPFRLCGRIIVAVPVDIQVLQLGIVALLGRGVRVGRHSHSFGLTSHGPLFFLINRTEPVQNIYTRTGTHAPFCLSVCYDAGGVARYGFCVGVFCVRNPTTRCVFVLVTDANGTLAQKTVGAQKQYGCGMSTLLSIAPIITIVWWSTSSLFNLPN